MQVYLVRHAEAARGYPDELRPLTEAGTQAARELGERLRAAGVRPSAVLSSPLRRAYETATELALALGVECECDARLRPGCDVTDLRRVVDGRGEPVVVVGHQPDCGQIVAALTGGPKPRFAPAAMVVVELDD